MLTKDQAIRRNPLEEATLRNAGLRVFVLTASNMTGTEMGAVLVAHLHRIEALARSRRAPFIARVTRSDVEII